MLFVSKNCSLEKVAFKNSSCFMMCVLDSFYGNSKAFSCYSRKMFFRKGFEPEVHGNLTRLSFLSSRTPVNNKVAAISKMMELPGDK